jgi:glycine/D-amino acid oxidase-like deaminating enzyme
MKDYCIIGAGIIGLSTAYELSNQINSGNITVLSKACADSKEIASVVSGGAYRYWHANDLYTRWVMQSEKVMKNWQDHICLPFYKSGLTWKAEEILLNKLSMDLQKYNLPYLRNVDTLTEINGGYFDTARTLHLLKEELVSKGVKIIENCMVHSISEILSTVEIRTNKGIYQAEKVIIAAGSESYSLHPSLHRFMGHKSYAPILTGHNPHHQQSKVMIDINEDLMIICSDDEVKVACGNSIKNTPFSMSEMEKTSQFIQDRYSDYTGERLINVSINVGAYDNTKDGLPVIGYLSDRIYAACGFNGTGFKFGPFVGSAIANEIVNNIRHKYLKTVHPLRYTKLESVGV